MPVILRKQMEQVAVMVATLGKPARVEVVIVTRKVVTMADRIVPCIPHAMSIQVKPLNTTTIITNELGDI